jgi:uncharacterized protein (DUF1778 family)
METLTKSSRIARKREKLGKEQKTARFDAKLTLEQKELFLQAATLKGFRSLTDFVVSTVQEKALSIIKEHRTILASEKDKDIFFEALLNPKEPSVKLIEAAKQYKALINK